MIATPRFLASFKPYNKDPNSSRETILDTASAQITEIAKSQVPQTHLIWKSLGKINEIPLALHFLLKDFVTPAPDAKHHPWSVYECLGGSNG